MSKNIKLNDTNYNAVSTVQLPTTDGVTATFKDVDEIVTPSGEKTITENGIHDVTNFAQVVVNVPTNSGSASGENSYEMGTFTLTEIADNYTYEHSLGRVPKFVIVYPISIEKGLEAHTTYSISSQAILNGLGQTNYNISTKDEGIPNNPFAMFSGIGYSTSVTSDTHRSQSTYETALKFTETTVVVGQMTMQSAGQGHLTVGTYGIIVG